MRWYTRAVSQEAQIISTFAARRRRRGTEKLSEMENKGGRSSHAKKRYEREITGSGFSSNSREETDFVLGIKRGKGREHQTKIGKWGGRTW